MGERETNRPYSELACPGASSPQSTCHFWPLKGLKASWSQKQAGVPPCQIRSLNCFQLFPLQQVCDQPRHRGASSLPVTRSRLARSHSGGAQDRNPGRAPAGAPAHSGEGVFLQRPFFSRKPHSPAGSTDLVEAATAGQPCQRQGSLRGGGGEGRCLQPPRRRGPWWASAPGSVAGRPLAAANRTMWALGCHGLWPRCGQLAVLLLLLGVPPRGLALPPIRYSHAGICPNDMNPNLWVDAQSTCKRECDTDQVSGTLGACGGRGWGRLRVPCRAQGPEVTRAAGHTETNRV